MMEEIPDAISVCKLEVVLMPNGEVICLGKRLGMFEKYKKYLTLDKEVI